MTIAEEIYPFEQLGTGIMVLHSEVLAYGQEVEKATKGLVEKWIKSALVRYVLDRKFEIMHLRVDELFLLWSKLNGISFKETCEYFGIAYKQFDERNYPAVCIMIYRKYPEEFQYED